MVRTSNSHIWGENMSIETKIAISLACAVGILVTFLIIRYERANPPMYSVSCPSESRNPMEVTGKGYAGVERSGWGVIQTNGIRTYFWPGGCSIKNIGG